MMRESIQRELDSPPPSSKKNNKKKTGWFKKTDNRGENSSMKSITTEERPASIQKYTIPDRPDRAEYQAYVDEQHKKLAAFLKFKSESKLLSKETARLANAANGRDTST